MISYLLTSYKEPHTVGRAMEAIINQKSTPTLSPPWQGGDERGGWELLVTAPDEETLNAAQLVKNQYPNCDISVFRDEGKGKPAALNLLFSKAKGDFWVLTDGDVWMDGCATEKLLLVGNGFEPFPTNGIGLVSGHPVPTNDRNTLFGFWAHVLTASADYKRKKLSQTGKYFDASGYLLAVRKECLIRCHPVLGQSSGGTIVGSKQENKQQKDLIFFDVSFLDSGSKAGMTDGKVLPESILVDDAYLSHMITNTAMARNVITGFGITYAPDALVHVKFPTTFSDWMKQKIRSVGGSLQIQQHFPAHARMRFFWQEAFEFFIPLKFVRTPKEFFWLLLLYFTRLYLWLRIFIFYKIQKRSYPSGWPRIESTK